MNISAFVGHSFSSGDSKVVNEILHYLDTLKKVIEGFDWDHAEEAEPRDVQAKVLNKFIGKNLFIGICTAKERVIESSHLERSLLRKTKLASSEENFKWKTSDWIIQEIGLAIGKGMGVILLVEEGVRLPGGLQGNLEYITFKRDAVVAVLPKLMQMIASLTPKINSSFGNVASGNIFDDKIETLQVKQEVSLVPAVSWTKEDYIEGLFQAVFLGEKVREDEIAESFESSPLAKDGSSLADFKSLHLHLRHLQRSEDVAADLITLIAANPESTEAKKRLAMVYESSSLPEQAAKIYSELCSKAVTDEDKLLFGLRTVVINAKNNRLDMAGNQIEALSSLVKVGTEGAFSFLLAKARIAQALGNELLFCALLEGALHMQPEQNDLRFELAYKYSELAFQALALKHYKVLAVKRPTETVWNNIGVAYSSMNFLGMSIDSYLMSKDLGGTLAVSNIAQKLVGAGFYAKAEELCREALKKDDCDKRVGTVLAEIEQKRSSENKSLEQELKDILPVADFFNEVSAGALAETIKDGDYLVESGGIKYQLKIREHKVAASYTYEVKKNALKMLLQGDGELGLRKIRVTLTGTVSGRSGFYTEESVEENGTLLGSDRKTTKGLFVFDSAQGSVASFNMDTREILVHAVTPILALEGVR